MLTGIVISALSAAAFIPQTDTIVQANGASRLELESFRGEVVVRTWDRDAIQIKAQHSDSYTLRIDRSGSTISVEPDVERGFLLDGFPRSIPQAEGLDRLLTGMGVGLDTVIKLDVPKKVLFDRMVGRRICRNCASVYNIASNPSKEAGVCDRCGSKIVQRGDDAEETVRKRLTVYEAATAPLIDYYDGQGLLVVIDGDGAVADVRTRLADAMRDRGKSRA
jgi:adenylate kinase family enzyme